MQVVLTQIIILHSKLIPQKGLGQHLASKLITATILTLFGAMEIQAQILAEVVGLITHMIAKVSII